MAHKPDEKLIGELYNFSCITGFNPADLLNPFFSKIPCDACGSKLFGDRHHCSATQGKPHISPRKKLEVCVDCYEYFFT